MQLEIIKKICEICNFRIISQEEYLIVSDSTASDISISESSDALTLNKRKGKTRYTPKNI